MSENLSGDFFDSHCTLHHSTHRAEDIGIAGQVSTIQYDVVYKGK